MRVNQVLAAMLLSLQVAGCAGWRPVPAPTAGSDQRQFGRVRVLLTSGQTIELRHATMRPDTLVGVTRGSALYFSPFSLQWVRAPGEQVAVPLDGVATVERRGFSLGRTLIVTTLALGAVIGGYAISGGMGSMSSW
jgi:hypothetical protein